MYRSVAAAAKAAIEGETADFDTQQCLYMQEDILSSSPPPQSPERAAVASSEVPEIVPNTASSSSNPPHRSVPDGRTVELSHHAHPHADTNDEAAPSPISIPVPPPNTQITSPTAGIKVTTTARLQDRNAGNSQGVFRRYDRDGNEVDVDLDKTQRFDGLPRPFTGLANHQPQPGITSAPGRAMYTQTQRDSWSPTQENTPSVYARYNCDTEDTEPQRSLPDVFTTDPITDCHDQTLENRNQASELDNTRLQHASTVTDSTAQTYKEQDTGHINFDGPALHGTQISVDEVESQEVVSQDAAHLPDLPHPEEATQSQCDPETPAPPVNPFMRKGSVMKVHELFGATQPSSVGRLSSPTSSRPSPDVFNARQTPSGLRSSPLVRRFDAAPVTSPLHSSVRHMLAQPRGRSTSPDSYPSTTIPATSDIQSSRLRRGDSLPEPQAEYISMKESQERRANITSPLHQSEDDDSDIDSGVRRRYLRRKKELEIQKELSAVEIIRASGSVPSSREVEVPSTGRRRRSMQEEYIAQCEGSDARDTQQDDGIIADSQGQVQTEEGGEEELNEPTQSQQSQHLPVHVTRPGNAEPVPELDSNSNTREATSEPPRSPEQHSTLPLQELNGNENSTRGSLPHKTHMLSDAAESTVPETSPARLRPMGEIANLSFSAMMDDELYQNIPGLTQDHEYNRLMGSSPPVEHIPSQKKRFSESNSGSVANNKGSEKAELSTISSSQIVSSKEYDEHDEHKDVQVSTNDESHASDLAEKSEKQMTAVEEGGAPENSHGQSAPTPKPLLSGSTSRKTPAKARVRSEAEARLAIEAQKRAEERRDAKIAFRKTQIEAGTDYEPDASDQDEFVRAALQTFKDELALRTKSTSSKRTLPAESSPDPLADAGKSKMKSRKDINERNEPSDLVGDETPRSGRAGLRTKNELKGSSRTLRKPDQALKTPPSKKTYGRKGKAKVRTPDSLQPPSKERPTPNTRSSRRLPRFSNVSDSTQSSPLSSVPTSVSADKEANSSKRAASSSSKEKGSVQTATKRKRKSVLVVLRSDEDDDDDEVMPSKTTARTAKRKSETAPSSTKPVASYEPAVAPATEPVRRNKKGDGLFANMAFAVSYAEDGQEKDTIIDLIQKQGGEILEEGFDKLLDDGDTELVVSKDAQNLGFVALITDEHSRKAKYMQALAMGLPCLSGRWIMACHSKKEMVNWAPYLLCAGISSFLGNTVRSRTLQYYSASTAHFVETFNAREKLLGGQSIMLIAGSGKTKEKRKAYIFLARVLAPARFCLVSDYAQAREKLLKAEASGENWDCLYVDSNESAAAKAVFNPGGTKQSRKRKRNTTADEDKRAPKKIRVISDEVVVQSLISGQLLEED